MAKETFSRIFIRYLHNIMHNWKLTVIQNDRTWRYSAPQPDIFLDVVRQHRESPTVQEKHLKRVRRIFSVQRFILPQESKLYGASSQEMMVFIKQFSVYRPWGKLRHFGRASMARRAARHAERFIKIGFQVAKPLAVGEYGNKWLSIDSYLIMELLPADSFCSSLLESPRNLSFLQRRRLISDIATFIRHVHDKGVYFKDLKWNHISAKEINGHWEFTYIDYDDLEFCRRLNDKKRCRDVFKFISAPVALSLADRWRFLSVYNQQALSGKPSAAQKDFARRVMAWANEKPPLSRRFAAAGKKILKHLK